ncbi:2-C-methyl-D-erythritol 4-phosphate cytidylyltransferase [Fodinisporobacter ferrooxydans]|uniref:2-C-methyl-D-erythritol 4-phosphate cytidylyltransferase n=1 Tax=Fodinisporobacter ferrooxydans TaxID=2901836 RepID=A0ABY4CN05_9BACL|nr:2-C-methyl-D-erythritol 4-phosphate cytidylyltransferase [Alicyclobacillaceae bacterium MYW30-H2]
MIDAVVVAAGSGNRMRAEIKKQYMTIGEEMLFIHTVRVFDLHPQIRSIVLVVSPGDEEFVTGVLRTYNWKKQIRVVAGGQTRQESVFYGLQALDEGSEYVAIHDGARPFLSQTILTNVIHKVYEYHAVAVAVPVKDTIAVVDDGKIQSVPERSTLWSVQTPQAFQTALIRKAHAAAVQDLFSGTDDASLVRRLGHEVHIQIGGYSNMKLTTPEDLVIAQLVLQERQKEERFYEFNPHRDRI